MENEAKVLTPEQWEKYAPVLQEMEKYRNLSEEEKEQIILQIVSSTYIDLMCDWALSQVEDNAHYHKYIVITSQTSRLFTKR